MDGLIHPLAHVAEDVTMGAGTRIWQFASVIRGATLGLNCNVASCAIVDAAKVGNGCLIGHGAQLHPGFVAHDEVFIGPGAIACNDMWPSTKKDGWDLKAFQFGFMSVLVKTGASIGAGAVLLPGVVVGEGAVVSAGSVVDRSVPDGHLWMRFGGPTMKLDDRPRRRMRIAMEC